MDKDSSTSEVCEQVRAGLSAYLDGETTAVERLGIERHVSDCPSCGHELVSLRRAIGFVAQHGRDVPTPPSWEALRASVESASGASRSWGGRRLAIAASVGGALLVGFLAVRSAGPGLEGRPQSDPAATLLTAGLPGLEAFLAEHQAEEVAPAELGSRLGFDPAVPEELADGYRLAKSYVVRDRCCTGTCLIYRRGDQLVTVIQQSPLHPVRWGDSVLEEGWFAGLASKRGSGRDVQILQIDPGGRNLTVIAGDAGVDLELLARALIEQSAE